MPDCKTCAKKLFDASKKLGDIVKDKPGSFNDVIRLRAEHYLDAIDIVCPDMAEERLRKEMDKLFQG